MIKDVQVDINCSEGGVDRQSVSVVMVIIVMLKNNADRLFTMAVMVILDYWC